uniref:Uncharacterized protein n=1 Tax=Octactis speculum TaxID=3111310 RepID=A0A7S2GRM4_9STRA|mmetsp:Transcript_56304/g.76795  ORF Transcript_56304/g.76795 Transcript_56304/m.76795 type:complete len:158 (+) Transcript_56304:343-816(+)
MEKTEAKKHEEDDKKKLRDFKLEHNEIFRKSKEISVALSLEKTPCSRHGTKHHMLVETLSGLEKDLAKQRNVADAIAAKNAPKASIASGAEKVRTPCPLGGAAVFKDTSAKVRLTSWTSLSPQMRRMKIARTDVTPAPTTGLRMSRLRVCKRQQPKR